MRTMAKAKSKGGIVSNKALYSRISYLYQAAAYLEAQSHKPVKASVLDASSSSSTEPGPTLSVSRCLLSDLRNVSLKAQIRLSPALKHTICKRCNSLLLEGSTCSVEVENKSRGGKKPWADVLVRTCKQCSLERRIPVGIGHQKRRPYRIAGVQDDTAQRQRVNETASYIEDGLTEAREA